MLCWLFGKSRAAIVFYFRLVFMTLVFFAILLLVAIVGYVINVQFAVAIRNGGARLHLLASFHGMFLLLLVIVFVLTFVLVWLVVQGIVVY